jgi:hypothetical protein
VREVGAWLVAHPQVVAIKAPAEVVERYQRELDGDARIVDVGFLAPGFTWRGRQAVICAWASWDVARRLVRRRR